MRLFLAAVLGVALTYLLWIVPDFVALVALLMVNVVNKALAPFGVAVDMSWLADFYSWIRIIPQVAPVALMVLLALSAVFTIFEMEGR